MIDITLLGTAALMPIPERALTAVLLECGGHSILFDCGEGTQTAARKAGVSLMRADMIALTHYHGDHTYGLPGLLQTMGMMGRRDPLYITGPEGLSEILAPILMLTGWIPYELKLLEFPEAGIRLADMFPGWPAEAKLTAFATEHRVASQGYVFTLGRAGKFMPEKAKALGVPTKEWKTLQKGMSVTVEDRVIAPELVLGEPRKGLRFVFSGDTRACDSLLEAAKGADLLICEATYGENDQAQLAIDHGHMNFAQAAGIAAGAGADTLWLAHYSQMVEDPQACLKNAADIFPNTVCGTDGMQTRLVFAD